jgi:hypothetical protein
MAIIPMTMPRDCSQRTRDLAQQLVKTLDDSEADYSESADAVMCALCAWFAAGENDDPESLVRVLLENIAVLIAANRKNKIVTN